jgi:hypothetical protein
MIRALLAELERGGSAIGVDELARRLGTSPAAIDGALELLARKGRLVRAGAETGVCDGCAARSMCNPLMGQTTRFIPVPQGTRLLSTANGDAVGICAPTSMVRAAALGPTPDGVEAR